VKAQHPTTARSTVCTLSIAKGGRMPVGMMAHASVSSAITSLCMPKQLTFPPGSSYQIHRQEIPEMDMFSRILIWLDVLKARFGRPLQPDDHVFPHMSANGVVDPTHEMSFESFSKLLNETACAAGLKDRRFSSHSFRRGAAQWRFMRAPPSQRWTLDVCRWWGGWAEKEGVSIQFIFGTCWSTNMASRLKHSPNIS
jgi:hypothetical protein